MTIQPIHFLTADALRRQMWGEQCAVVQTQLLRMTDVLNKYDERDLGAFYMEQHAKLKESGTNPDICANVFERLLMKFSSTSQLFQELLAEDWRNVRTPEGTAILGYPNFRRPFGLGNGDCTIAGYLPEWMERLLNREKSRRSGLIAAGTLKPGTLIKRASRDTTDRVISRLIYTPSMTRSVLQLAHS